MGGIGGIGGIRDGTLIAAPGPAGAAGGGTRMRRLHEEHLMILPLGGTLALSTCCNAPHLAQDTSIMA